MPEPSLCRYCGAKIVWALLIDTRPDKRTKPHPFDLDPVEKGRYYLYHPGGDTGRLLARYFGKENEWPPGAAHRVSHFATCDFIQKARAGSKRPPGRKP